MSHWVWESLVRLLITAPTICGLGVAVPPYIYVEMVVVICNINLDQPIIAFTHSKARKQHRLSYLFSHIKRSCLHQYNRR